VCNISLTSLQNIEKAKKEIARLEAEEAAEGSGASTPAKEQADKAVAEATEKVAEASLEDKAPEEAEATA
jgi:hypothetical protein